jgi:Phage terminase large subunit
MTPLPDTIKLKTTYKDNKFLDAKYIEVLESLKYSDPVYYNIYCLGEWGSTGHLVWNNYKIEEIPLNDEYYDSVFCGLDFGFNDPSALVKIGVKDGELYILDEIYKTGLTNRELIKLLEPYKDYRIIADSAEPSRIKEFYQNGFNIKGG